MTPVLVLAFAAMLSATPAFAQAKKADPRDATTIETCLKDARSKKQREEGCIGTVADPCLEQPSGQSTAGASACLNRELLVWDDMLTGMYEQLRKGFTGPNLAKLQAAQREWLEARKQSCELYWEFLRGTSANPIAEGCYLRETANRALYLQFFVDQIKK
jgi:uncharacterized protein YecT (DUF1311 family)